MNRSQRPDPSSSNPGMLTTCAPSADERQTLFSPNAPELQLPEFPAGNLGKVFREPEHEEDVFSSSSPPSSILPYAFLLPASPLGLIRGTKGTPTLLRPSPTRVAVAASLLRWRERRCCNLACAYWAPSCAETDEAFCEPGAPEMH